MQIAGGACIIVQGLVTCLCPICASFQHRTATGTFGQWTRTEGILRRGERTATFHLSLFSVDTVSAGYHRVSACSERRFVMHFFLRVIREILSARVCSMWRCAAYRAPLSRCPWKYGLRAASSDCVCVFVSEGQTEIGQRMLWWWWWW